MRNIKGNDRARRKKRKIMFGQRLSKKMRDRDHVIKFHPNPMILDKPPPIPDEEPTGV